MKAVESCCTCKFGVESPDVKYAKSRLIFTFITINLLAAAMGLNRLALTKGDGDDETILGRTSLVQTTTIDVLVGNNQSVSGAITLEFEFTESDVCDDIASVSDGGDNSGVEPTFNINKSQCESIKSGSVSWLALGVVAILIQFVLILLLMRIECRKLCSKGMDPQKSIFSKYTKCIMISNCFDFEMKWIQSIGDILAHCCYSIF